MIPTELRIGNHVYIHIDEYTKQTAVVVKIDMINNIIDVNTWSGRREIKLNRVSPISLDKGILSDFGFWETSDGYENEELTFVYGKLFADNLENNALYLVASGVHLVTNQPIKYVHQLQNLYFDLAGNELQKK